MNELENPRSIASQSVKSAARLLQVDDELVEDKQQLEGTDMQDQQQTQQDDRSSSNVIKQEEEEGLKSKKKDILVKYLQGSDIIEQ